MINIIRERWILVRTDTDAVFCGFARRYKFVPIDNLKNESIKTYTSESKALSSFKLSWGVINFPYKAIKVKESIESI